MACFCTIVPPHILHSIVASDAVHDTVRDAAHATLSLTQSLMNARQAHVDAASLARNPTANISVSAILPPHILESIAVADPVHPEVREAAQRTLQHDQSLRDQRQAITMAIPAVEIPYHLNRIVYNCNGATNLPGRPVRGESTSGTSMSDPSVTECFKSFGDTFHFYSDVYSRNSIDNAGLNLLGTIHYSNKYNNAFWNGRQMVFGDGDGTLFNRFTAHLDVIGHELTHGVVQYTCNLQYQGESGALNESIADVFGSMIKQHKLNQKAEDADWLIGQGLFTGQVKGVALRSLKAPGTAYDDPVIGKDPQPGHYKDLVVSQSDNGGVHINSGIPNHAFYLIAIALEGYSWEKAGKIWFDTISDPQLSQDANFKTFAALTVSHAFQLFGEDVSRVVAGAWAQVGISFA
jgi:Zn-dependent metalloprotease